jgi:nickel superoxide dismutase
MNRIFIGTLLFTLTASLDIEAHCQMPCGIYHDDLVFDQIDQYVETIYKGISVLTQLKSDTIAEQNELVRWVMTKDRMSDETANILTEYFLQQKIKPDETDTVKRLVSAHRLLFLLVRIKQTVDIKMIQQFEKEWESFKLLFHIEGYEYQLEEIKERKRANLEKKQEEEKSATSPSVPLA